MVASKRRPNAAEREDGSRKAARHGEERSTGAVTVDHAALARTTRRHVVSGGGEIGRQVMALGRGASCRRVSAAGSTVEVEHAAAV